MQMPGVRVQMQHARPLANGQHCISAVISPHSRILNLPCPLHPDLDPSPMLSSLDRKMLRDLSQMKGQSFAIAIVIAAGVATFVNSRTILHSLELTRSTFYERYRFADVFATVKRAPDSMIDRIAEIPGVAQVETRIVEPVTLDVPGLDEPAVGQLISLPVTRPPRLNQLYLRRGRQLAVGRDDEVLASEAFLTPTSWTSATRSRRSSTADARSCASSASRSRPSTSFRSSRATCCPTRSTSAFCGWTTKRSRWPTTWTARSTTCRSG